VSGEIKNALRNSTSIQLIILAIIVCYLLTILYNGVMLWFFVKQGNDEMFERMSFNNATNLKEIVLMALSYIFGKSVKESKDEHK
jgi:amino acid transporter